MLPLAYTARFVGCPKTSCATSIAPILTTTWRVSLLPIASIAIAERNTEEKNVSHCKQLTINYYVDCATYLSVYPGTSVQLSLPSSPPPQ